MNTRRKSVSTMQKEVVSYYLDDLTSPLNKEEDIHILIEQAKALKDMVVNESIKGNFQLLKYFDKIGNFMLECYERMPKDNVEERTSIEQAIEILNGLKEKKGED